GVNHLGFFVIAERTVHTRPAASKAVPPDRRLTASPPLMTRTCSAWRSLPGIDRKVTADLQHAVLGARDDSLVRKVIEHIGDPAAELRDLRLAKAPRRHRRGSH